MRVAQISDVQMTTLDMQGPSEYDPSAVSS